MSDCRSFRPQAYLYTAATGKVDLNNQIPYSSPPVWILQDATAINDSGQIVAFGVNLEGYGHALLLTPVPAIPAPNPKP